MRKIFLVLAGLLSSLSAYAADNTVILTPGSGVTMRSKDVGAGVEAMMPVLGDTSGNALATAPGTPNAAFALPIQGVTSGTPVPISGSLTNISGTISLPTGAATSANQATEITSLSTIATNTGAAIPAGTNLIGYTTPDVCSQNAKSNLPISQNGTSSVQLIALSGSTTIYVCSVALIAAGATTVAITTGTGTACVTNNAAVFGTTTAGIANSVSLAANGGLTLGNGLGTIMKGAASSELCMVLGTSVYVSGNLTYVQL